MRKKTTAKTKLKSKECSHRLLDILDEENNPMMGLYELKRTERRKKI